jgi:hypothetical protein
VKVLTHRPCYIEPVVVPEFGARTSSATEIKEIVPTTQGTEEPAVMPKALTVKLVETKVDKAEEPKIEEIMKMPKIEPSNRGNSTEGTNGFCRNS